MRSAADRTAESIESVCRRAGAHCGITVTGAVDPLPGPGIAISATLMELGQ
jgi:hypothetical protein